MIESVNTLSAGMVKDTSPLTQKEGTYPYALNAVLESKEGGLPFISNEFGTVLSATFPGINPILVGAVLTDTQTFICCIVTNTTSIIGEYFPKRNTFTTILNSPDLNFDSHYPVKMLFRIRKGCIRTIYFTDNNMPYRTMDIDNVLQYGTPFEADNLNLSRNLTIPSIEVQSVEDFGGSTKLGNYQYYIQYLDEDLNETLWVNNTAFHPVVDEPLSSAYYQIDGGINLVQDSTSIVGAVPLTTKSVVIGLDNLDSNFAYYRIAVVMCTAATGEVSEVYKLEPKRITSSSEQFTFRGITETTATISSLDEIQNNNLFIHKAGSHAQIDNRLILGNLSSKEYNWAQMQQGTELVRVDWTTKGIVKDDIDSPGAAKSPKFYLDSKSFLRNEVYALGVYGILNNRNTPVFHIPGRAILPVDEDPITVIADGIARGTDEINLSDVKHLGFENLGDDIGYGVDTVPRWLVFNTAANDRMAYWESDTDYPDDLDCNGNRVYPEGKIRHHKFPSIDLAPIEDDFSIRSLGIIVDLTDFVNAMPPEITIDILEWRIVRASRTETDRTILDKGFSANTRIQDGTIEKDGITIIREDDRYYDFAPVVVWPEDLKNHYFFSPKQMVNRPNYPVQYITTEAQLEFDTINTISVTLPLPGEASLNALRWAIHENNNTTFHRATIGFRHIDRYNQLDGTVELWPIFDQNSPWSDIPYPFVNQNLNGVNLVNPSFTTPISAFSTLDDYDWHEDISSSSESTRRWSYISLMNNNRSAYSNLNNLEYVELTKTGDLIATYYGGDIFITKMQFKFLSHRDDKEEARTTMNHAYFESEINMELRHAGLVDPTQQSYFKGDIYSEDIMPYCFGVYPTTAEEGFIVAPEFIAYNPDFSKHSDTKPLFALPFNYNWCLACSNQYPYDVIASEKSFQSDIDDKYKSFKANNRMSLNGDCGGLEHLITHNDQLYALTYNYPVFIPTRPQTINTNEDTAYVGTGEIFSIPPKKLSDTLYPYGGCRDWMSVVSTEYGLFYADSENGKIHRLGSPVQDVSAGISNWLEENLPLKIHEQFERLLGYRYPWTYPTNGVGIVSSYDPRYKRYIFTKHDLVLDETKFGGEKDFLDTSTVAGFIYWEPELKFFFQKRNLTTNEQIDFGKTLFIETRAYTLSYSCRHNAWASYHSYLPYFYMNDGNDFYSSRAGLPRFNIHNKGNYQMYLGQAKKDFVIEFISNKNPEVVKTFESIEIVAESTLNDIDSDIIFNKAWLYNSYQSTGFRNLRLKSNLFDLDYSNDVLIDKVQNNWKLNNFRNYLPANTQMSSSAWADISTVYFTDKIPVNTISNPNLFTQSNRLRDRYLTIRLSYNQASNNKITVNLLKTQQNLSYR